MKKFKSLLLAVIGLLCSISVSAHDFEVEGIYYNITSSTDMTLEVTYRGYYDNDYRYEYSGAVNIPESVTYNGNTYSVTSIGDYAFSGCSGLTSVEIPNSVASIGYFAFRDCSSLTSVVIPNNVTSIGSSVFRDCSSLTSVEIPNSVTSIGSYAFYRCSRLTSVEIPNSVTSIGDDAFSGCSGLTSVEIPNSVTSIGDYAFSSCSGLTSVVIPNSVTSIGTAAFRGCSSLTSVVIGNSVTSIGAAAFSGTAWYNNQPDGVVYFDTYLLDYKGTMPSNTSIKIKEGTLLIAADAFRGCSSLTSVVIPNSVTSIGAAAFYFCSGLTSVEIPNSVTSIGSNAFKCCSSLTSVVIGNSVTSIGDWAFEKCSSLTSVQIPNSVTSIGDWAFYDCSSLTSVVIGNSVTSIGDYAFRGCSSLTSVMIPNSVISIGKNAFSSCSGLTSVVIPNSVTSIGDYAFYSCSGLTSVVIGNSVTSIGDNAFYNCEGLKVVFNNSSLTFTKGSSSYGYIAYYAKDVYNGYEQVDDFIFAEANDACYMGVYIGNATELVLPANYKGRNYHIGQYAFKGCSALTSLTIGAGVLSIGSNQCSPTKTIWLTNTPPSGWKNLEGTINYVANEQYGSSSNVKVYPYLSSMFETDGIKYVPVSPSERTCDAIDCNYDSAVEEINIGETVSYRGVAMTVKNVMPYVAYGQNTVKKLSVSNKGDVGASAFYMCSALTNATISNEGNIGENAFYGCSAITNATISNEGNIGASAFESALKSENATIHVTSKGIADRAFYGCTGIKTAVIDIRNSNNEILTFEDWTSPYTNPNSTSSKTYAFTLQQPKTLSFDWWVSSEAGYDKLIVVLDGSTVLTKSGEQSGRFSLSVSAGTHTLVVKYIKDGRYTSGQDKASVYNIEIGSSDISQEAFRGCTSLTSLTLGDNLQSIGESAFRECSSLTEVKIPNLVTRLGDYCFASTTALKHVELCDSLQGIGIYCFSGSGLESISIPASVKNIGDYAFDDCTKMTDVVIEDRAADLSLGSNGSSPLFADCPLDSVYIGGNISYNTSSESGYSPFYRNTSLRSVVIADKVEEISAAEFRGCTSLASLTLGDSIQSIGESAFRECSSLTEVKIPNLVTQLGNYCFASIPGLKKVELGDSLQTIGEYCFSGAGLESISIPASVTSIGNYAFDDCTKMTDVVIEDRTADLSLGSNGSSPLFADCPLDSVYIGGNITYNTSSSCGYSPFYRNTSLRSVVITDQEEEISDNEFYGCTNLKNVTIGSDVKKIGNWAFSGCSNLDYFSFGKSVEAIGQEAFSDCVNLTKLISYAEVPPTCGTMALDDINKWNCVLQVPGDCISAYQQADQWKEFFFIEEVLSGIGEVTMDGAVPATADVYGINGMLIKRNADVKNLKHELPAGIYIIGGKKVWVK